AQLQEKQIVAAPLVPGGFAAVTTGAPGVFHPRDRDKAGEFLSAPRDAARLARFARLRHEGVVPPGASLKFSVRSGNAEKPDGTWAPWVSLAADGTSTSASAPPAGRYLQWRVEMTPAPKGEGPVLERVEMSYLEQNARPILEGVNVLEPGAVFSRSSGSGTAVLSVTNPDENGVYAGLEGPREPDAKKLFRKGFRTVQWRGSDPNGDPLRYLVEARAATGTVWFPIRREEDDSYVSFDTAALPDGRYRFRVTASDRLANPEGQALVVSEEAPLATIDNTPPALRIVSQRIEGDVLLAVVEASDALSAISKAELSVNADRWRLLSPDDGASDGPKERYTIRVAKPKEPSLLSVRVLEGSGNVAAVSLEFPGSFEESKK
ncbi:MAG: hypothetical protein JNK60_18320, partial [Acidobacteria bacterium]|nr:hypothetical protein [Acidobacteriota bacterium]